MKEYLQSWILNSSKNEINSPNSSNQPTTNIKKTKFANDLIKNLK
ncbi:MULTISPECIES: hypothetical protein [unclassified Spiroplasma]